MIQDSTNIIDWSRVILSLRSRGLSAAAISRKVNADKKTIARLANGDVAEPKFSAGVALLDLHLDVCRDRHNLKELRK
jgi:hypothetical protein